MGMNSHLFGKELLNSPAKAQVGNSALRWMSSDTVQVIGRTPFWKENISSMFVSLLINRCPRILRFDILTNNVYCQMSPRIPSSTFLKFRLGSRHFLHELIIRFKPRYFEKLSTLSIKCYYYCPCTGVYDERASEMMVGKCHPWCNISKTHE